MKLSEMRDLLAAENIQLSKSLGQNFLHDTNQLKRIIRLAEVGNGDRVLEIGPGLGPLTELLVASAQEVLAMEKDRRLVNLLRNRFRNVANLQLVHADALEYLRAEKRDWSGWKVVSNLPYSVASPLLVDLAHAAAPPAALIVTLQLEVVRRLLAKAGAADYGLLTVLMHHRYRPVDWFKIPASSFFPVPDVDSATIKLEARPKVVPPDELAAFVELVKLGFSQRRKMLFKLLKSRWPEVALRQAFEAEGLPAEVRAESLAPEQFAALARFLYAKAKA